MYYQVCHFRSKDSGTSECILSGTNQVKIPAPDVARAFKERLHIALSFKNIKQQLEARNFIDTSENALLTHAKVVSIAHLLSSWLKFESNIKT
jgi:IS4 transposase